MNLYPFNLSAYLASFISIDVFFAFVTDSTNGKIETIEGAFEQITAFKVSSFSGKNISNLIERLNVSVKENFINTNLSFFQYLEKLPIEKRPTISLNRIVNIKTNTNYNKVVLIQTIPVELLEDGLPQKLVYIVTDISKHTDKENQTYILDASNKKMIKRIPLEAVINTPKTGSLSKAELKVLKLMADGLNSKEIGFKLSRSEHTIYRHRKNMLRKYECTTSIALINKAKLESLI